MCHVVVHWLTEPQTALLQAELVGPNRDRVCRAIVKKGFSETLYQYI